MVGRFKFPKKKYVSSSMQNDVAVRYRRGLEKHPFLLFGLPFITIMVAGSFFLTPVTAVRYEKHDKKQRFLSKDEALGIGANRRKVDVRDEYYVGYSCYYVISYYLY
jgi:cytochrome c oxidase assembly protein subunit 16